MRSELSNQIYKKPYSLSPRLPFKFEHRVLDHDEQYTDMCLSNISIENITEVSLTLGANRDFEGPARDQPVGGPNCSSAFSPIFNPIFPQDSDIPVDKGEAFSMLLSYQKANFRVASP